ETWRQLERKFLDRYFPIHKFLERRAEISNFEQADGETLYDAWERFKVCLKRCPNHGFDGHNQMQMFTQGLRAQTRMILDASAGGAKKRGGVLELDTQTALLAQQKLMTSQMEAMMKTIPMADVFRKVQRKPSTWLTSGNRIPTITTVPDGETCKLKDLLNNNKDLPQEWRRH
ncbi:hypothetical protein L195_g056648, partial [Trifolium pratense]